MVRGGTFMDSGWMLELAGSHELKTRNTTCDAGVEGCSQATMLGNRAARYNRTGSNGYSYTKNVRPGFKNFFVWEGLHIVTKTYLNPYLLIWVRG